MNRKQCQDNSISAPLLRDAVELQKANLEANMPKPAGPPELAPSSKVKAELDQDPGSGYNPDHTDPQV